MLDLVLTCPIAEGKEHEPYQLPLLYTLHPGLACHLGGNHSSAPEMI